MWFHRYLLAPSIVTALACSGDNLGVSTGILQVSTATAGSDPDPDGYTVAFDGGAAHPIGVNGSVSVDQLVAGAHTVQLSGIASNCAVQGSNPTSVTVSGGSTVTASFAIACAAISGGPTSGSVHVTVATTGSPPDPDGYLAKLDNQTPGRTLGVTGFIDFAALPGGTHSIELSGISSNCTLQETNPQTIAVTAGQRADVSFSVVCGPATGATGELAFVSTRYQNELHIFLAAADGTGLTELSRPGDDWRNPVWSPDGSKIAFVHGAAHSLTPQIAVMNADGSGARDLTTGGEDYDPHWSPDGQKILFQRQLGGALADIYVMNPDGSGQTNLTNNPQVYFGAAWSPSGDKIAFTRNDEIVVANPDGSGATPLGKGDGPVWSPDGSRIAFVRVNRISANIGVRLVSDIWSMNATGGDERQLTRTVLPPLAREGGAGSPAWSPDGRSIAFHSGVASPNSSLPDAVSLFLMNADGTNPVALSPNAAEAQSSPRWSPDGSKIAFQVRNCCSYQFDPDVVVINANGTGRLNVSHNPAADFEFAWKP